jgi:hypothetical protein
MIASRRAYQDFFRIRIFSGFLFALWTRTFVSEGDQALKVGFVLEQGDVALRKAAREERDAPPSKMETMPR